jgi:transposase-like protein
MSERKRRKHDYSARLKYIRLLESGWTFNLIRVKYGIDDTQLKVLWEKYQQYGEAGLHKSGKIKADFALKKKIVLDIEENHLTLHAASLKYGASPTRLSVWLKIYRESGLAALETVKKRGRPPGMGRPIRRTANH